jgi:hypothetical protein
LRLTVFITAIVWAGIAHAAPWYSAAQMQIPAENNANDNLRFTTPPTPAAMGPGGETVGFAIWGNQSQDDATLWKSNGTGIDLYATFFNFGQSSSFGTPLTRSLGINSKGEIAMSVGSALYVAFRPNPVTQPNTWSKRLVTSNSQMTGIRFNQHDFNAAGAIVVGDATGFSYYFSPTGVRTSIPSYPDAMNDAGVFVTGGNQFGSVTAGVATIGTFPTPAGYTSISLRDINNAGVVSGSATNAVGMQPVLYTAADGYQFLPLPDGYNRGNAMSINDAGDVVGYVQAADNTFHATLWHHGLVYLLKDLTSGLPASVLNSTAGEITNDNYIYFDGRATGALVPIILSPLPDPATLGLFAAAAGVGVLRRQKRS